MAGSDDATVPVAELRRVLHEVNNFAAKVMTKSEVALASRDVERQRAALERVAQIAEDLGAYVRHERMVLTAGSD